MAAHSPPVVPPSWLDGRCLYQIHALGALDCPPRAIDGPPAHRLPVLTGWLDHVAGLGCGGLVLTPIFSSMTHGYDTVDPFRIDPRLGDDADFDALVRYCRDRDLRLVLDGVFNHVGRAFPRFADVLERGRHSESVPWFRIDFEDDGPDGFAYADFEGHAELVAMNHGNPEVLDWAVSVATHWLDRGIDGWRLDAAYAVPTTFWSAFCDRVRAHAPNAYLFGEVIHGDYPQFVRDSGVHSVTQYELHKAVWSSLNDRNFFELAWNLKRHAQFCESFVPLTFLGNHDVTRLLSQLTEPRHLGHALAVLFCVPGTPCVYYGDELGYRGVKEHRRGGDDAIRPPLPASAQPVDELGRDVLATHAHLIAVRRARPWLDTAKLSMVQTDNERCQIRVEGEHHAILIALNVSAEPMDVAESWHGIAGHGIGQRVSSVPPGGWAILQR